MSVNLYHSRRNKFRRCEYWLRDESESRNLNEWVLFKQPEGIFYAKESNAISNQGNSVNGVIMIDKDAVTLETDDEVENITRGCVVEYLGHAWFVDDVQFSIHSKETQFSNDIHATTYIRIRR